MDVLLPSGLGDHITIPHVNLSILDYEPDSLRTSSIRSPPVGAQEVSVIPQLDGPGSLPIKDDTRGRMGRFLDQVEPDPSQGGTYVQRASTIRRREYPGEDSDSDDYRRLHRDQRPPDREGHPNRGGRPPDREEDSLMEEDPLIEMEGPLEKDILMEVGDPLEEEDTLVDNPLMEKDPLNLLEDEGHQALKDLLGL